MSEVAVTFGRSVNFPDSDRGIRDAASELARDLNLPLLQPDEHDLDRYGFVLNLTEEGLELISHEASHPGPLRVDFGNPVLAYRVRNKVNRQMINRAVGVKPGLVPSVLDATAGLGRDAFLLAIAGCRVKLLEKNPVVHALLRDGLSRAGQSVDEKVRSAIQRMSLLHCSLAQFVGTKPSFDVVYLDPMFPTRRKSAQVKKDMFLLQKFFERCESHSDDPGMMADAFSIARRRVVIKRPLRAPDIDDRIPTFRLIGRSSRFDVYVVG
jgi:16S rRNA (guanine1516-N2)-methyltransferase